MPSLNSNGTVHVPVYPTPTLQAGSIVTIASLDTMVRRGFEPNWAGDIHCPCTMTSNMLQYAGREATVTRITGDRPDGLAFSIDIDNGYYNWHVCMIEDMSGGNTSDLFCNDGKFEEVELYDINQDHDYGQVVFRIRSTFRDGRSIFSATNGIRFNHCSVPEVSGYAVYLLGDTPERDDALCKCGNNRLYMILQAIDEYHLSQDPRWVRKPWMDSITFFCNECGFSHPYSNMETNGLCKTCVASFATCGCCGNRRVHSRMRTYNGTLLCPECCVEGRCNLSGNTGILRKKEFTVVGDYHGDDKHGYFCSACYDKEVKLGVEHHYHYVPDQFFFWDIDPKTGKRKFVEDIHYTKGRLFMGIEIESMFPSWSLTNVVLGNIQDVYGRDKERLLYAKHDGTVPSPGSELVTHPMTLDMIRSLTWEGLYRNIIKPDTKEIGGHIHINKTAFRSIGHSYKFLHFLRTNLDYVTWVGERSFNEWCKTFQSNGKTVRSVKQLHKEVNSDRYEAINFTKNTIELRFFWTPWKPSMLYRNAEFVNALWTFTHNSPLHFSVEDFENWLSANCAKYPYFYNYMKTRNPAIIFDTNGEQFNTNARYDRTTCRGEAGWVDWDEMRFSCSCCGYEASTDYVIMVNDEPYCDDCTCTCPECDTNFVGDVLVSYSTLDGYSNYVCEECRERLASRCDNCGEYVEDRSINISEDDNQTLCTDCLEDPNEWCAGYAVCDSCDSLCECGEHHGATLCESCYDERELEEDGDENVSFQESVASRRRTVVGVPFPSTNPCAEIDDIAEPTAEPYISLNISQPTWHATNITSTPFISAVAIRRARANLMNEEY